MDAGENIGVIQDPLLHFFEENDSMIYTEATNKALKLMCEKHRNQRDRSGLPYILHPFHVAEQMDDEESTVVALLHDIVEDTNTTFEDLKETGFSERVISALRLMTREEGVDYYDYVKEIGKDPLARKVKIADLEHNMQLERLDVVREKDLKRLEKYRKCHEYLCELDRTTEEE